MAGHAPAVVTFLAFQPNATSEPPSPSAAGGSSSSKATAGRRGRVGEASSSASPSAAANASSASSSSAVALTFDGPSPAPSLKGELGFDYLAVDDIAPFPEASLPAVTHKTLAALQTADWPEIFHTLNSVRRRRPTHGQPAMHRPPALAPCHRLTHPLTTPSRAVLAVAASGAAPVAAPWMCAGEARAWAGAGRDQGDHLPA